MNGTTMDGRVSSLETSVENLRTDIQDLKKTVQASLKTNWGVLISGVGLVAVLWAAAIRPVSTDVARLDGVLTVQTAAVNVLTARLAAQQAEIAAVTTTLETVRTEGSPITRERLSRLEYKAGISNTGAVK